MPEMDEAPMRGGIGDRQIGLPCMEQHPAHLREAQRADVVERTCLHDRLKAVLHRAAAHAQMRAEAQDVDRRFRMRDHVVVDAPHDVGAACLRETAGRVGHPVREQIHEHVADFAAQFALHARVTQRLRRGERAFEQRRELHARAHARGHRQIDHAAPQRAFVDAQLGGILDLRHQRGIDEHADQRHVVG